MAKAGFVVINTGGGCEAWSRGALILTDDLQAPKDMDCECTVVAEDSEGASDGSRCFHSVREFLEILGREDFDDVVAYITNGNGEWHVAGEEGKA